MTLNLQKTCKTFHNILETKVVILSASYPEQFELSLFSKLENKLPAYILNELLRMRRMCLLLHSAQWLNGKVPGGVR